MSNTEFNGNIVKDVNDLDENKQAVSLKFKNKSFNTLCIMKINFFSIHISFNIKIK